MKIVKLTIENIMRLSAVEMEPSGAVVVIGGNNAQGKSSVLAAIEMALGGGKHAVDKPVRDGAEAGSIIIDLGEIQVERTFGAGGGTKLVVRSANGAVFPSPQAMLDHLIGKLTFDPLAFSRAKPSEQANVLRALAKIDVADIDMEHAALFAQRTTVNREAEQLGAAVSQIPDAPAGVEVPDVEPDVPNLLGQLEALQKRNAGRAVWVGALRDAAEASVAAKRIYQQAEDNVKAAEDALERAKMEANLRAGRSAESDAALDRARIDADKAKSEMESDESIKARIAESQKISALVRAKLKKVDTSSAWIAKQAAAKQMTDRLNQLAAARRKRIAEAAYPIAGLALGDDFVSFNGIPLSQASGAEQLRISVAIGLALNPKLKVMIVRDGSLLDENGMKLLGDLAAAADGQVWLERVGKGDDCQFVIEDGHLLAPPAAAESEAPAPSVPMPGFSIVDGAAASVPGFKVSP